MTDYVVKWAAVGLPTGELHKTTKDAVVRYFGQGELVKRDEYDSDAWRDKFDRLVEGGALVDKDAVQEPPPAYNSAFDIPLVNQPDGGEVKVEVDTANDDLDDDEDSVVPADGDRPSESASTEVWRQYAQTHGVELANLDMAKRGEIIDAAKAQGK